MNREQIQAMIERIKALTPPVQAGATCDQREGTTTPRDTRDTH